MVTREDIIAEALLKCKTSPIKTVARGMIKDYPQHFNNLEAARAALRYELGAIGKKNLYGRIPVHSSIAEGLRKLEANKPREEPLQLGAGKYLAISDLHVPHHDSEALAIAIEYGLTEEVTGVLINGDFMDCYTVSKFNKDPNHIPLREEFLRANMVLDMLQEVFEGCTIAYKLGNHERRFKDYLRGQAKELDGLVGLTLEDQLRLDDRGIQWRQNQPIQLGHLFAYHGDELARGPFSPVLPARSAMDKARTSVLIGHHHRTSELLKGSATGEWHGGWGLGCLCSLYPDYNPSANLDWNHGFAIVEVEEDLGFSVSNKRILNGKVR